MDNVVDQFKEGLRSGDFSPRSKESQKWFLEKVKSFGDGSFNRDRLMRAGKAEASPMPGKMYMFWYDPKLKKELPYYDKFPLIVLVDTGVGGLTGLNLHYLPIGLRQKFFYGGLINRASDNEFDANTHFNLTYDYMKQARSLKAFRPCFKKYLTRQIRGRIVNVPADEWELAIHLPTASFQKMDEQAVHRKSEEIIGRF